MKISEFNIFLYELPLLRPFYIGPRALSLRSGFIIQIKSDTGISGFGEIAPLPHLSKEHLEDARRQILAARKSLLNQTIPDKLTEFSGRFETWFKSFELYPSVHCGLEMAVLNLLGNAGLAPFDRLAHRHSQLFLPINGLVQGTTEEACQQARHMVNHGFRSIKLKVGGPVKENAQKTIAIRNIIKNHATLRLDANQAWSFEEAIEFGKQIGVDHIDYIEEPFVNYLRIPDFFNATGIPAGLDESISKLSSQEFSALTGLKAAILKPTLLGGFEACHRFIEIASQHGRQAVISSSFESGVGTAALATFAALYCGTTTPAGLHTFAWFKKNIFKKPITVAQGNLDVAALNRQKNDLDFSVLKKLSHE